MIRRIFHVAGALALVAVLAPQAQAQPVAGPSCTVGTNCVHTLNATVPTLVRLTLENAATALGSLGSLGSLTQNEFDNGQIIAGPRFEARANRTYNVTLAAASANWNGTGNAAKVASDVGFAVVTSAAGCGRCATTTVGGDATDWSRACAPDGATHLGGHRGPCHTGGAVVTQPARPAAH